MQIARFQWIHLRAIQVSTSVALCVCGLQAQHPVVSSGTLHHIESFSSAFVPSRPVDVWLPEGYNPRKRYPVLYLHDGQMLFDSTGTWNGQEWQVDETMDRLIRSGAVPPCIVVGVWNAGPLRRVEYFPQKAFELLPSGLQDSIFRTFGSDEAGRPLPAGLMADRYLRFLVEELKPYIDRKYATRRARKHTMIAGSSMGGLISLYAICEYPGVFGGAACMSTHWPGIMVQADNPVPQAIMTYFQAHIPKPGRHRLYFDRGTLNLDAWYAPYQLQADEIMRQAGYTASNWVTRVAEGDDHNERSWSGRLEWPLRFLMKGR
jgi:enterochelin esterase-like enzyme